MKVYNVTSNVSGREVPNQFVIHNNNETYFQSYSTVIAKIDRTGTIEVDNDWAYSSTTGKYRNAFFSQYVGKYTSKKELQKAIDNGYVKVTSLN